MCIQEVTALAAAFHLVRFFFFAIVFTSVFLKVKCIFDSNSEKKYMTGMHGGFRRRTIPFAHNGDARAVFGQNNSNKEEEGSCVGWVLGFRIVVRG